ncbi:hypothetical protein R1flu_026330 [Riccia fluitans]|uniref:Uncharacterized protein n=1 Tax=Riccia fluitans TaxID=41844 RepID=A0ABD1XFP4_9MARC
MAQFSVQLVVLVALSAVMFSAPVISARYHNLRQSSFNYRGSEKVMCLGSVAELLSQHEGRQHTAYDHKGGFRAIGCGYNLDENQDQRRKELEAIGLEFDKVYNGEMRLNSMQITELLMLDAMRALNRVGENIRRLDNFCCSMKAVFADIQHTAGSTEKFPRDDINEVIERVANEDYRKAADELERTEWCSKSHHRMRCDHNLDVLERGCESSSHRL